MPTSSHDIGIQLQEYFKAAENIKDPLHIPTIMWKKGGFHWGIGCGWIGLSMCKERAKIEVSELQLVAEICT